MKQLVLLPLLLFACVSGQFRKEARWCVVNDAEAAKCRDLIIAIMERYQRDSENFPPDIPPYPNLPELKCVRANDRFACMEMISNNEADLIQLDPGMGYTAGEYFTMMPLMAERYIKGEGDVGLSYYAVAVVNASNTGININNLRDKKSCHTGVGTAAGWVFPISTLMERDIMPIEECNVPVKSAAVYFGDMCAPNGLTRFYNPFGTNPVTVCQNCQGGQQTYCSGNDPFAGYDGAFRCMASGKGDVAFVRHSTIMQGTSNTTMYKTADDYKLLCPDGSQANHDQYANCNWGQIPSHIVMTSAIRDQSTRTAYKQLMELISYDFGEGGKHVDLFQLFNSHRYGMKNVLFSDESKELADVGPNRDSYYTWVGEEYRRRLQILNKCPIQQARWCVISRQEMSKCENMIMAFAAKGLKPDLNCILGQSTRDCMDKIRTGDADMMATDAADVYVAGKYYGLVPIAAEDYSGYDTATYYAVAIARKTDSYLTAFNLKSRRSCHSGVMKAAGWVIPVDKLIETGQIQVPGCNAYFAVGQFFSKSCTPGSLDSFYNTLGTNPINLCEACASGGPDRCKRNDDELYFGNSGAFRCLVEMGGDVAFVKHTTVRENTDGRNIAEWSRNRRSDDYELLCNDGTRRAIDDWDGCNMGAVPANAILTAGFKTNRERTIYWTLLNYAQQFFASDSNPDFQMFSSNILDHKDLIFQDSTVRLVFVEPETETTPNKQDYKAYLGPSFMRAMERMESIDCVTAGTSSLSISMGLSLALGIVLLLLR